MKREAGDAEGGGGEPTGDPAAPRGDRDRNRERGGRGGGYGDRDRYSKQPRRGGGRGDRDRGGYGGWDHDGPPDGPFYGGGTYMGPPPPHDGPPVITKLRNEPEVIFEIPIPKQFSGIVIGPGGQAAAHVRRTAKVQLHVRRTVIQGDLQVVELKGTQTQCEAGVTVVRELIHEQHPEVEVVASPTVFCHVEVLPEMVGPVLGAKGTIAKSIRDKSGAQLKVRELDDQTGLQTITMIGTIDQVKEAYAMVKEILDKFDPGKVRGPSGPGPLLGPGPGPMMGPGPGPMGPPPYMGGRYGEAPPPYRPGGRYDEPEMYEAPPPYRGPPGPYGGPPGPYGGPGPYDGGYEYGRGAPGGYGRGPPMQRGPGGYGEGRRPYEQAVQPAYQSPMQQQPARADVPPPLQGGGYGAAAAGGANASVLQAAGLEPGTQILLLQPDGTYKPAQFVINGAGGTAVTAPGATAPAALPAAAVPAAGAAAAAPGGAAAAPGNVNAAALLAQLLAAPGVGPALAQHPGLAQYVQQLQAGGGQQAAAGQQPAAAGQQPQQPQHQPHYAAAPQPAQQPAEQQQQQGQQGQQGQQSAPAQPASQTPAIISQAALTQMAAVLAAGTPSSAQPIPGLSGAQAQQPPQQQQQQQQQQQYATAQAGGTAAVQPAAQAAAAYQQMPLQYQQYYQQYAQAAGQAGQQYAGYGAAAGGHMPVSGYAQQDPAAAQQQQQQQQQGAAAPQSLQQGYGQAGYGYQ